MGDLVLRTRVKVAKRNLRRIAELTQMIERYEASLRDYLSLPDSLGQQLHGLWERTNQLMLGLANPPAGADERDPVLEAQDIARELWQLRQSLISKVNRAEELQHEASRLTGDRQDVRDWLVGEANEIRVSLTIEEYLRKRGEIDSLFSEYVELLGGVMLRRAGFGDEDNDLRDLFLIADGMPKIWASRGWTWQSLALPALAEKAPTKASLLRIGFPEWTLWALPFVQNAFAHVFIRNEQMRTGGTREDVQMLADALATVTTGPAYACAALLLRLDPAAVTQPLEEAALRSATILRALERVLATLSDEEKKPIAQLVERLSSEWRDAIALSGGDVVAFEKAAESDSVTDAVTMACEKSLGLPQGRLQPPLWADRWGTVAEWAVNLRDDQAAHINLSEITSQVEWKDHPVALVLLLDAAWLARVGMREEEDAPDEVLDRIAKDAVGRMLEVVRVQGFSSRGMRNL